MPIARAHIPLIALIMLAGGCAQKVKAPPARPVNLGEFAQQSTEQSNVADDAALAGAVGGTADADDDAMLDDFDDVWFEDLEMRETLQPTQPGDSIIVDSLVGHINGRAVFADEFLEPIEDRLMRAADESNGVETDRIFLDIISEWLREVVQNELILAEAEAGLSQQEQMGLFAWIKRMGEEEVRKGGGTRSGAERRLQGSSENLDEYLGEQKDMLLIRQLQIARIQPRVVVSWRDIEREYERRYDEFNPPSMVSLARIRLSTAGQAALITDVQARIDAGEDFAVIAEQLGFPDGGRWETFSLGEGGLADIEVPAAIQKSLDGLQQGDTSPPIELGSGTVWVNVIELVQTEHRSIYDTKVQLALKNSLVARRSWTEWQRYVNSLVEEGIHDDLDEMAQRLFKIAVLRYAGH